MRNGYAEYGIPAGQYDREGNPMPLTCWSNAVEGPYKFVARTGFGPHERDGHVVTLWVGVPAVALGPPPGLIFATMVACRASEMDGDVWWRSTLQEAIADHDMVALSIAHELEDA